MCRQMGCNLLGGGEMSMKVFIDEYEKIIKIMEKQEREGLIQIGTASNLRRSLSEMRKDLNIE